MTSKSEFFPGGLRPPDPPPFGRGLGPLLQAGPPPPVGVGRRLPAPAVASPRLLRQFRQAEIRTLALRDVPKRRGFELTVTIVLEYM